MSFKSCKVMAMCAAVWITGCGGLSDVGKQKNDDAAPVADALVLNQPFTKDGSGKVSARVRSGAEVFLSGNDSEGTVAPVLKLDWVLLTTGPVASQVQLVDRNSSTVSFRAPQVAVDTLLQFRLTVTDSNGATDQADVDVTVVAAADPDRFLTHLQAPQKFTAVAVADSATALTADVPFEIRVQRTVTYVDLRGINRTVTPAAKTVQGTWLAADGAGATCDDYQNPRFAVDLPKLDINELAAAVRADSARSASEIPDMSQIDAASTQITLTIQQTGAPLPGSRQALLCVFDGSGTLLPADAVQSLTGAAPRAGSLLSSFSVDSQRLAGTLRGTAARTVDTRESAEKYYATIDDAAAADRKRSFIGWLKDNGFLPTEATSLQWSQIESGSAAHVIYVNNFDLGFGRDMYARRFDCVDPRSTAGPCVASVVVNYGSIEAAAKKLDPIVAVAMEYTPTPYSNGRRVVKFYTYAPNETNGDFDRIYSVDLDGRGEKYMPGSCTICHGGTPLGVDPDNEDLYAKGGDVNATFLPWDLESLLYSDSQAAAWVPDPADTRETSLHARFTRSAQEGQFRELNRLAYQTYEDNPAHPGRHDAARDLIETWYGDALDSATFQNRVPDEWGSDPEAQKIYTQVFAQHCRMCHVAQVPNVDNQTGAHQPYAGCGQTPRIPQYVSNVPGQIAFGCYDQFIAASNLVSVIQRGLMPNARLTMDRFWVSGGSGDSAATVFATHLQAVTGRTDLLQTDGKAVPPGRPVLSVSINGSQVQTQPIEVVRHAPVRVDATATQFADTYEWELCRATTAQSECASLPLVGATTSRPHFVPNGAGDYRLTLTARSSMGVANTQTYVAHVENRTPSIASCPTEQVAANGVEQPIPLACIQDGDGESTIQLRDPVTQAWMDSIAVAGQYDAHVGNEALLIAYTDQATTPAVLTYRVCDEDPEDCVSGAIQVNIASTLTAVNDDVNTCLSNTINTSCIALPRAISVDSLLLNDVVRPTNDAVTLTVGQPTTGSITPGSAQRGGSFTYSAPRVLCDITGLGIEDGGDCADTFAYTITSQDGVTQANAQVRVFVRATTSFSQGTQAIHDMLESNCAGCHNGTAGPAARWTLGPLGEVSDPAATLKSIKDNDLHVSPGANAEPPILAAPCATHFGAVRLNAQQCDIVEQWLKEGAHLR